MEKTHTIFQDTQSVSQLMVLLLPLGHIIMMEMGIAVDMSASIKTLMEPGQK